MLLPNERLSLRGGQFNPQQIQTISGLLANRPCVLSVASGFTYKTLTLGAPLALVQATLPPPVIQPGLMVRLSAFGTFVNNTGGSAAIGIDLRINGTQVLTTIQAPSMASTANPRTWRMLAYLFDSPLVQSGYQGTPVQSTIQPVGLPSRKRPTPSTFAFTAYGEQVVALAAAASGTPAQQTALIDTSQCSVGANVQANSYNYVAGQNLTVTMSMTVSVSGPQAQMLYGLAEAV